MRTHTTSRLVLAALMCALTAVLSQIQIPLPPVPISLSLLGVHLCGALMPPRWSAASMAAYMLLGAAGMPVYAGLACGPSVLFGPSGGFILGYILCAALEGALICRLGFTRRSLLAALTAGTLTCYTSGLCWFTFTSGTSLWGGLTACVFPFLPGDALKIALAAALALRLQKPLASLGLSR